MTRGVSVVVPAYNEERAIECCLGELQTALASVDRDCELIVVDDGSSDRTGELAEKAGARVIALPENRGYGAALKAGVAAARYDTIAITDADGTYPASSSGSALAG